MSTAYLTRDVLLRWVPLEAVTLSVVRYGYELRLLSARDVVDVELARYDARVPLDVIEEKLALLLSDDLDRVGGILRGDASAGSADGEDMQEAALMWFYSAASELHERWHRLSIPAERLDALLEYLDLDRRYSELTSYAPVTWWKRRALAPARTRLEERLVQVRLLLALGAARTASGGER